MWNIPWNFSISRILSKELSNGVSRLISNPVPAGAISRTLLQQPTCRCTNDSDAVVQKAIPNVFTRNYTAMRPLNSTPRSVLWSATGMPLFGNICNIEGDSKFVAGTFIQLRGLKFKGKVKRRCKDCFMMWINGNLWNLCHTKQRHKQILKPGYFANQRILTHATQHPRRPW